MKSNFPKSNWFSRALALLLPLGLLAGRALAQVKAGVTAKRPPLPPLPTCPKWPMPCAKAEKFTWWCWFWSLLWGVCCCTCCASTAK